MRVKFPKNKQREFLEKVLENLGCPNLRELINRGVDESYSSLKNYFSERRLLSLSFFENLCALSGLKKEDFIFEILGDNWGQIKGGKKKRKL